MTLHSATGGVLPVPSSVAQAIRNSAGVPSNQTVGPRYADSAIGLDGSTLTTIADFAVGSEANISAQADSGTGTSNDPYIVLNRSFDAAGSFGINWNDSADADYHFVLQNCQFENHTTAQALRCSAVGTGSVTFQNCDFVGGTAAGGGFTVGGSVDITFDRCTCNSTAGAFFRTTGAFTGSVTITDSIFTDSTAWTGTPSVIDVSGTDDTQAITVQYCRVDGSSNNSIDFAIRPVKSGVTSVLNTLFTECGANSGHVIAQGGANEAGPLTVTYCRFVDSHADHMNITFAEGHVVTYCDFLDNDSGSRGVNYVDAATNINDVEIAYCYFHKETGAGATEENCFGVEAANVVFHDNWCDSSTEDAFEFVRPRTGCEMYNLVGDGITLQLVNVFQRHGSAPGDDVVIRNIYGSCTTEGVMLEDQQSARVENVHVDTPAAAVELADNLGTCDNCTIFGPVVNNGGGTLVTDDTAGTGNVARGIVGTHDF